MNKELRESIYNIGKDVAGLTGGIWYLEAPPKTQYPYAVFSFITNLRESDSIDAFDTMYLQINGYHKDANALEIIGKDIEAKFDKKKDNFIMESYWLIDIDLQFSRGLIKSENVFQFTQQYKIHIQHK